MSTACATFVKSLPEPPETLVSCAKDGTVEIPPGDLTDPEAAKLLRDLRLSELDHDRCADFWAMFYDVLRAGR